jgi:hypothetical protein
MLHALLSLFAAGCGTPTNFFSFPTWYKYLPMTDNPVTNRCEVSANFGIPQFPLIALALVDIGLRVASLVAVGYIIYGGVQFVTAQGESDQVKKARQTIINALIGLVIAMISTGLVAFIGARIGN